MIVVWLVATEGNAAAISDVVAALGQSVDRVNLIIPKMHVRNRRSMRLRRLAPFQTTVSAHRI